MPTSRDLHPLTNEQQAQLRDDLALVEERLRDIAVLIRVCYDEGSHTVIRADEATAALAASQVAIGQNAEDAGSGRKLRGLLLMAC